MKHLLLSLVAGIVLFVWGFISWAVLPWHMQVTQSFSSEAAVVQMFKEQAPQKGVYFLPRSEQAHQSDQLRAFVNVVPEGSGRTMKTQMISGFILYVVIAYLVLLLLRRMRPGQYWQRVGLFSLIGFIIGFACQAMAWNWFDFPLPYVAVGIADEWISWTLVGLLLSRFIEPQT